MSDDLGYECLGVNGSNSYQTPFLDQMAREGINFEHCHSTPLCTPTRVQLMTGKYNVRNYTGFGRLERDQTTFAHLFKQAGYATCISGKWQLGRELDSPHHFGFDEYCLWQHQLGRVDSAKHDTRFSNPVLEVMGETIRYTGGGYGPDVVSDYLCDFMTRNRDKPFFAYYPMILTHCPFTPTPDSRDWDPEDMGSLEYKGDTAYFDDMVNYMDKIIGKIIAHVEDLGLMERTLIMFTGDNGADQPVVSMLNGSEYPGGKSFTTGNGTHVPLIVQWKGTSPEGKICHDLVDFTDILPTICQAAGIDIPDDLVLDGKTFLPQLYGKKGDPREWIYCWYDPHRKDLKEFVQDKHFKLYRAGEFYNVEEDLLEQNPISRDAFGESEEKALLKFQEVLGRYENVRDPNI